jgi:hypothetical protein
MVNVVANPRMRCCATLSLPLHCGLDPFNTTNPFAGVVINMMTGNIVERGAALQSCAGHASSHGRKQAYLASQSALVAKRQTGSHFHFLSIARPPE